jgi:diketogulonate reductase-like aldo/keto reductase
MQFRKFGSSGIDVSVIGQGTWNIETFDRATSIRAFHRGLEVGMTHIDTAYDYGNGAAESFVGEALKGKREQAFLVSKVLPAVADYEGTIQACEWSLGRLQTDYLDCFLLHWWEDNPLDETFRAFEKLKQEGKIRSYGVSNLSLDELKQAVSLVPTGGITCHQIIYNLQTRDIEREMLNWCTENKIAVVGYAPYGDVRAPGTLFADSLKKSGGVINDIAASHQVSERNVALAFLLRSGVFVIPKSERPEFAEDNAKAAELALTAEDVRRLDAVFPLGAARPIPFTNEAYKLASKN